MAEERIFYRVTGRRDDATAVVQDALSRSDAERKAAWLSQARRAKGGRWLPGCTDIRIIPSEPVTFKYEEGELYEASKS